MPNEIKLYALVAVAAVSMAGLAAGFLITLPPIARYIFSDFGQFLVAAITALIGINMAKRFTVKGAIGRSMLFISLAMASWSIGVLLWLYYNVFQGIEIPYPSAADIFYMSAIPLAIYGFFCLWKNIAPKFDMKTKLKVVIIPAIFLLLACLFLAGSGPSENVPIAVTLLNIFYPLSVATLLSFTILILTMIRGSKLFKPVFMLCAGFIVQALASMLFSWSVAAGIYYVGWLSDIIFLTAFCITGIGLYFIKVIVN
jgi:hypothetical protein